jgi:hypothetical protein
MADIKNGTVTITGLDAFEKKIKELETTNPGFEKRLRSVIREVLGKVRSNLSKEAKTGLNIKSDPRNAYKAVRYAVYRRILGGQVNILQSRKAGAMSLYEPPRKGLPKRGGNRVLRSKRTTDIMSYQGKDRGFILRFLNQGTGDRAIHTMGGNALRTGSVSIIKTKSLGGNRGNISAKNWFGGASHKELEKVAQQIQEIIDKVINEEFV